MPEKLKFKITEKAGAFVAGRRSPGTGKTIALTEAEARYALIAGELVSATEPATAKPEPATEDGASADSEPAKRGRKG